MTSIAVTASMCASAAEVALLVASFMPVLPRPGRDFPWRGNALQPSEFYSEHPTQIEQSPQMMSPCGNVDCASVEQYCGGNLTPAWPAADTVLAK